jgi:hypothetical protein
VVAREAGAISSAQMYNIFGGKTESIEVFWDLDDARQWLDERLAHARETDAQSETPRDDEPSPVLRRAEHRGAPRMRKPGKHLEFAVEKPGPFGKIGAQTPGSERS